MTLEIRTLTSDEIDAAELIAAAAFGSPSRHDLSERLERIHKDFDPQWYLGAFEDGEMTAMMRMIPSEMWINGGTVAFGTVSPVASSPLHRRKGHTGAMLRRSLAVMRERGQAISGLYTPHPALYRRYGWEIASEGRTYSFKPKDYAPQVEPAQRGRFRSLKSADWEQLDRVYQAHASRHNGPFRRTDWWWRHYVLETPWRLVSDIVLWESDAGVPEGYAAYQQTPGTPGEAGKVVVLELVALTPDAYLNLVSYFARHDIHGEIVLPAAPDDRLPVIFTDAERLELRQGYGVLLRVCDFAGAMAARPPADADEHCEVTLQVDDRDAPWNDGAWRVGVAEGKTWAERVSGGAELRLSARMLGPIFNGYLTPTMAADLGLISAAGEEALERAGRVFAVRKQPYFPDHF